MDLQTCAVFSVSLLISVFCQPVTYKDSAVANDEFLLHRFKATDWLSCIVSCQDRPDCVLYVYQYQRQTNGMCELYYGGQLDDSKQVTNSLRYLRGYLFQQIKEGKSQSPSCSMTESLKTETECIKSWTKFGSSCFKPVSQKKPWEDARQHCLSAKNGSHLTSILNKEENDFLVNISIAFDKAYFWVGLSRSGKVNTFTKWEDGNNITYNHWMDGQSDVKTNRGCVNIKRDSGEWKTWKCDENNPSICRYEL